MKFLVAGVAATVGVAIAVQGHASASARESVAASAIASPETRSSVELDHPISAKSAASLLDSVGDELIGFRFHQPGLVGEMYPTSRAELAKLASTIKLDHGVEPAISELIISSSSELASVASRDTTVAHAASFPEVEPARAGGPSAARATKAASRGQMHEHSKRVAEEFDPSPWAPNYTEIVSGTVNGMAKIETWSQWTQSSGRQPELMPDQRGLEVEVNLYNSANTGTRPLCFPSDAANQFWLGSTIGHPAITSWALSTPFLSLDPAAYGAYADTATYSDSCAKQSVAIGIGYPTNPPGFGPVTSRGFITTAYGYPGTQGGSPFAAGYQAVTNDCDNLGREPASDCMGLNPSAGMPNGWAKDSMTVNIDRNWFVPGCYWFFYEDSTSAPSQCPPEECYI